jgi:iron(III) transport system permease protein
MKSAQENSVQWSMLVIVGVLVLYPLGWIVWVSGTPGGHLSLSAYTNLFADTALWSSFAHSVGVASASSVIALFFGVPLAFLAVRTDLAIRRWISLLAMVPFITPAFIGGLAWVVLGAPRTGLLNFAGRWLGLSEPWLNMYSLGGMICTLGVYMSPYVFVVTSAVLAAVDPSLEEAAALSGSRTPRILWSIVLPLAIPGITAGALLAFVNSVEQFGIAQILGRPANVFVLPTEIYSLMNRLPQETAPASAASMLLLALSAVAVVVQQKIVTRRSYVTVGGKGYRQRRFALGAWTFPAYLFVGFYTTVAVALPVAALLLSSFLGAGTLSLAGNTFGVQHYTYLFKAYPATIRSLRNGIVFSTIGATIALALAVTSAYFISRHRSRLSTALRTLITVPLALPGIVIGTGMLLAYIRPPLVLYGTLWILIVSYITRFLPFAERTGSAAFQQLDRSLEEASVVCGAGWLRTFHWVLLPLIRPALIGGWLLLFVSMIHELGTSVLLYSFGNEVPAVVLFDLLDSGNMGAMSAYATVLLALSIVVVVALQRLVRIDLIPST